MGIDVGGRESEIGRVWQKTRYGEAVMLELLQLATEGKC